MSNASFDRGKPPTPRRDASSHSPHDVHVPSPPYKTSAGSPSPYTTYTHRPSSPSPEAQYYSPTSSPGPARYRPESPDVSPFKLPPQYNSPERFSSRDPSPLRLQQSHSGEPHSHRHHPSRDGESQLPSPSRPSTSLLPLSSDLYPNSSAAGTNHNRSQSPYSSSRGRPSNFRSISPNMSRSEDGQVYLAQAQVSSEAMPRGNLPSTPRQTYPFGGGGGAENRNTGRTTPFGGDQDIFSTVQSVRTDLDASVLVSSSETMEEHHEIIVGRSIRSETGGSGSISRYHGKNQYEVFEESAWGFRINDLQDKVVAERRVVRDKDLEITALRQALQKCSEEGWKERYDKAQEAIGLAMRKERGERERADRLEGEVEVTRRELREAQKEKEWAERRLDESRLAERALIQERDAAVARFETVAAERTELKAKEVALADERVRNRMLSRQLEAVEGSKKAVEDEIEASMSGFRAVHDLNKSLEMQLEECQRSRQSEAKQSGFMASELEGRVRALEVRLASATVERDQAIMSAGKSESEAQNSRGRLAVAELEVKALEEAKLRTDLQNIKLSGMLEEREREAKEAGEELREALLLGEGVEEECKVLRKRLQEAQGRIKGAQGDIEEAQDRAEGLERALQACKKSEGSAKEEVLSLKDEVGELEGGCMRMRAEVSVAKASLVERSKGEVAAKSLAERLGGELELERVSVLALEERLSNVGSQRSEFHARACRAEKGLDEERGEAERLREEVMRLEGEVAGKGEAAERLEGEGRALRGELDALRGELAGARALLDASRAQVADLGGRFEAFVARQTERGMAVAVRVIDRMRNLAVGRAFSGWRDKAGAQARAKDACSRIVRRMKFFRLSRAWEGFKERASTGKRVKQVMGNVIAKWSNQSAQRAFAAWIEYADSQKRGRASARRVIAKWSNQSAQRAFAAWEESTQLKKGWKASITRVLCRWTRRLEGRVLSVWASRVERGAAMRAKVFKVVRTWSNAALARAWNSWLVMVDEEKTTRALIERVVHRWMKGSASRSLNAWAAKTEIAKKSRAIMARVCARWAKRALVGCIHLWRQRVCEGRRERVVSRRVVALLGKRTLLAALNRWREFVEEAAAMAGILHRAVNRWTQSTASRALRTWADYVERARSREERTAWRWNMMAVSSALLSVQALAAELREEYQESEALLAGGVGVGGGGGEEGEGDRVLIRKGTSSREIVVRIPHSIPKQ